MKNYLNLLFSAVLVCAGCVHLPSTKFLAAPSNAPAAQSDAPASASPAGAFVRALKPGASQPAPLIVTGSPAKQAIQRTVNWLAVLCTLGGVACLVFAGLLGYGGQVIPAIKFGLAGLLLPIFGIWFAYHWLAVVICSLLAAGGFFIATHFAVVKPLLQKLESVTKTDAV